MSDVDVSALEMSDGGSSRLGGKQLVMDDRCARCYVELEKRRKCGRCRRRLFCSKACQSEDWIDGQHKVYCSRTGEMGTDVNVEEVPGKGMGLVTLRPFKKWEKILVERPVIVKANGGTMKKIAGEGVEQMITKLMPERGSDEDKFSRNCMALADGHSDMLPKEGLCLFLASVNHNCLGNSDHWYDPDRGVVVLVASRAIQEGESITFSYAPVLLAGHGGAAQRQKLLLQVYGITCHCHACTSPDIERKILTIQKYDTMIPALLFRSQVEEAIKVGNELLQLLDDLSASPRSLSRTHYDLLNLATVTGQQKMAAYHKRAHKELKEVYL